MSGLDLEAVRRRYADFMHYWPDIPGAHTGSERTAAAKRCARDVLLLLTRVRDLEHELRLLRQHVAGCERCAAVESHDRDKALENA